MKYKISVAGTGPGGEDYILPAVRQIAKRADVLVGGKRALTPFVALGKEMLPITADLEGLARQLRNLAGEKRVAVLVSGDPGFYSLLAYLRRHFSAEELNVLPGVSSVQAAFARLGEPWQDAVFLSAHGRDVSRIMPFLLATGKKALLTDRVWTPGRIARVVLEAGGRDVDVAMCRNLTMPNESVERTRLSAMDGTEEGDCVMVIFDE
jgi:precorrin-6y C5,15-methyltransferase (decarboxylating) CbiE subunit